MKEVNKISKNDLENRYEKLAIRYIFLTKEAIRIINELSKKDFPTEAEINEVSEKLEEFTKEINSIGDAFKLLEVDADRRQHKSRLKLKEQIRLLLNNVTFAVKQKK